MEEPVVEIIESATDLTPVLEALERLQGQLEIISQVQIILCGVILGMMVILVLAVMFRA